MSGQKGDRDETVTLSSRTEIEEGDEGWCGAPAFLMKGYFCLFISNNSCSRVWNPCHMRLRTSGSHALSIRMEAFPNRPILSAKKYFYPFKPIFILLVVRL